MEVITHAFSFNSADIPRASGCLSCPDFTRTAQLVQQPAKEELFSKTIIKKREYGETCISVIKWPYKEKRYTIKCQDGKWKDLRKQF